MTQFDFDIGIIGGGAAGLTVTAGAAQLGARTLLIEKEPNLGGDCLHYGCVPSKTLIRAASVYHLMKTCERFGLPKVALPPVDFQNVADRIRSVIATIQQHDSVERFCKIGARVEFGQAVFTDEHEVMVDGKKFSASKWVIATGSSPAVPPVPGLSQVSYLTNREIFSLKSLPESMIVIGAGPIAIEMAQAFCRLGTKVDVVQRSGQILSREDNDLAEMAMKILQKEGVTFHLNAQIVAAKESAGKRELIYENSDGMQTTLGADTLLVALGRSSNVNALGLEQAGVKHSPRGIAVDSRMRTSQGHIYAAGDVTGAHQFTHAAGYEGGVIIGNAIFHLPRKADYSYLPWCTYIEPELASLGYNEKRAQEAGISYSVWVEEFTGNDRSQAEGETAGRIKLLLNEKGKPLGIQILGHHAGELLGEWVAAFNGKTSIATLAAAMHPYPTLGEINKRVSSAYLSKKLFSAKVRKALAFFFNLRGRACEIE